MSDQNARGAAGYAQAPYGGADTTAAPHRFIDQASSVSGGDERGIEPQAGLGPYTLREWIVIFLGLSLTVLSFFSAFTLDVISGYTPVWAVGITWLGAAFLPLAAVLLIGLRRFVPRLQNLGALSIDQFASVAFAVAAFTWLNLALIVLQISAAIDDLYQQLGAASDAVDGVYDLAQSPLRVGVIVWIALVVALAGVFFTVFARFVPPFSADFVGREQKPAHPTARPARPLAKRARPVASTTAPAWPAAAHDASQPAYGPSGMVPSSAPAPDSSAPPVPRPDGTAFGQPAPYGQYAPSSYGQETAPPYAQDAPAPYAQNAPAPYAQDAPASYAQDAAAPYTQDARGPYAQDAPASDGSNVPPTSGAPAPTDQPPAAEIADATPPVDTTAGDATPTSPSGSAQVAETPEVAASAAEFVAPAAAPVDADTPSPDATEAAGSSEAVPTPDAGTVADDTPAPDTDPEPDEIPVVLDAGASDEASAVTDVAEPDPAPVAASPSVTDPGAQAAPQAAATSQPFWALAPVERDVHDFDGNPIYRVGPTAWALVLEDRGSYFVMRHDDGRIGYLHDTSGITRG
ncbi:hypothetical protein GCM10010915_24050 [Microbacterium faecale]|uniref:Uncharacterized protein n=1 Tax=Microbacterium faecale TaxID=1804630 RepID=A0A917DJJ3_9MICO|nr:hypothetical protein [Microbacterium faecale]GGD42182.1 hypothetical protein GCM10010915_24050 [Microbacterium faecale]